MYNNHELNPFAAALRIEYYNQFVRYSSCRDNIVLYTSSSLLKSELLFLAQGDLAGIEEIKHC